MGRIGRRCYPHNGRGGSPLPPARFWACNVEAVDEGARISAVEIGRTGRRGFRQDLQDGQDWETALPSLR